MAQFQEQRTSALQIVYNAVKSVKIKLFQLK